MNPDLELILLVLGALVEGPVIAEPPDVVDLVEALDVVGDAVPLQHILALGDGRDCVDLQVWDQSELRQKPHPIVALLSLYQRKLY